MYSEWISLTEGIQAASTPDNVLRTFPATVGQDVVQSVLKPLYDLSTKPEARSSLVTSEQVQWTMQVVGHGLALPLTEYNLIQACIQVYDDWLSALYIPKPSVPDPIVKDPNHYAQIIFKQFFQLFTPRVTEPIYLEVHINLCKRVLQITHLIARKRETKLSRETWNALFNYLLKVSDLLLSPPAEPSSLGSVLCELIVHVLFESWLRACIDCFPTPNLWKSLRELCSNWRHHYSVVEQWNKLTYSLTLHMISHLYTPKYLTQLGSLPEEDGDFREILKEMPSATLAQCWFRMLHTLGNPVELSYPQKIASSPAFQKALAESGLSAHETHACLNYLPRTFLEAMKGVASLVYLFLGHDIPREEPRAPSESSESSTPVLTRHSPLTRRRDSKEGREVKAALVVAASSARLRPTARWYVQGQSSCPGMGGPASSTHPSISGLLGGVLGEVTKPKGNTLLHLFGSWLFEAAIWPPYLEGLETKQSSHGSNMGTVSGLVADPSHTRTKPWEYEPGRAEALGALCSIFSCQPCGEPFLPIYLARFYHALAAGLSYDEELCHGQLLTRVILTSASLLRKDLQGINILLPRFLSALELILPRSHTNFQFKYAVDVRELRHASIRLLLSMFSLPLHFLHQPIPDLQSVLPDLPPSTPPVSEGERESSSLSSDQTFFSLKDRMLQLLFSAIDHETDPSNMQMLLHGLMVTIQDIVTYENAVAKMVEEETAEDMEVSIILGQASHHAPLGPTRSDASSHSHQISALLATMEKDTYIAPPALFKHAVEAAYSCLVAGESSVQVSLAALELMAGLAQLQIENINHADCKQAVQWVCEYIQYQSLKAHPQHSRDLHTSIVAAFFTLLVWLMFHPYLLGNKNCLTAVMKVVELGISGSFSTNRDGMVTYKGEKSLKPISGRVRDIAEFVLACVMEKIDSFPSPCGAESSCSLLSEDDLLARLPPSRRKEDTHFRYFVMDNSVVLGLLEEPFVEGKDAPPTVTAVVRSPTGRHAWTLCLRHHPRTEQPSMQHLQSMPRPTPSPLPPFPPSLYRKPWPDEVDLEPRMKMDESIPTLEAILDGNTREKHARVARLTREQIEVEDKVHCDLQDATSRLPYPDPSIALEPPQVKESFETARLFLSHLRLLGIDNIKYHSPQQVTGLSMLDSSSANLKTVLLSLDRLPTRFCNTVFVLHCREGLSKPEDILAHQQSLSNKPQEFIEFLQGLGWTVDPINHPGFTGKIRPSRVDEASRPIGVTAQIPLRPFPYYADAIKEVAFIMPTLRPSASDSTASLRSAESSDSGQDVSSSSAQPPSQAQGDAATTPLPTHYSMQILREPQGSGVSESTAQAESERSSTLPGRVKQGGSSKADLVHSETPRRRMAIPQDCAAMVVWLEKFEDHVNFPLESLSGILHGGSFVGLGSHKPSKKGLPVIFIHKLSSGLYQIVTKATSSRQDCLAGPLIEGMVVSRRTLSSLVRQTAVNLCSRHRLENEGYSPPHVKRKRKIEEIASALSLHVPVADFYTRLFVEQAAPGSHNK